MPVRLGFIGCGSHARTNLYPCLRLATDCELIAVADLWEQHRAYCQRHFGARRAYADFRALLDAERGNLDGMIVCGPPALHHEASLAALGAGLPVLCEKPPATTLAQTVELRDAARAAGRVMMVAFMKRFAQKYALAAEIARRPEFGRRTHCAITYSYRVKADVRTTLTMMCVHAIDLMRHFMGDPLRLAVERRDWGGHTSFAVQFAFPGGGTGSLTMNATAAYVTERLELTGEGAAVVVDEVADLRYYPPGGGAWAAPAFEGRSPNVALQTPENSSAELQGYASEVRAFVDCVRTGAPPPHATIDDAVEAMRVVEVLAAHETGVHEIPR